MDDAKADELISGALKRSKSYHRDYGSVSYGEIKSLAKSGDVKARQMKKLIEHTQRLQEKTRRRPK